MPTAAPPTVKPLEQSFPVEVTYYAGVDGNDQDVIERAGICRMVRMASPAGEVATVTDKDARHNLVPLGWRPLGADEDPADAPVPATRRTPKETP